ncbi:MAG TPA: branched-chain amino acid ABC transporter permease [Planctomycetota bacterium]|nr:branched-chain amino acid ABC transporter permease [Planctomycetota bacterium]
MNRPLAWIAALALVAALPWIDLLLPPYWRLGGDVGPILELAIAALGLNLLVGNAGLLNLGSAAFVAVGAYAFSILTTVVYPFQIGFAGGAIGAMAVSALVGAVIAAPTLRLRGDYLAIVTLGFGEIAKDLVTNLDVITSGAEGLTLEPASGARAWLWPYYLALAILAVLVVALTNLDRSRFGRALAAVREDELAASASGVPARRAKLWAFLGCAALCGLYGALYANRLRFSGLPTNYDFQLSLVILSAVILGGMGSIPGVIIGAFIIGGLNSIVLAKVGDLLVRLGLPNDSNSLASPTNWKFLIFGLCLILMMRFRPGGLVPARRVAPAPRASGDGGAHGAA